MTGNLKVFRSTLREYRWLCDRSKIPGEFQVIGIFCYLADAAYMKMLSLTVDIYKPARLYDIVITDGVDKLKCVLAFQLSVLVHKNILKIGHFIKINSVRLCYLEGEFGERHIVTYVLLEDIDIVESAFPSFPPLGQIQYLESSNARELKLEPLVTARKYYLNVWSPTIPYGPAWTDPSPCALDDNRSRPLAFMALNDLIGDWRRIPKPYPALIIKIIVRGKLHHYGTNSSSQSYPFIGYFTASDSTAVCEIIVFGKKNVGMFYSSSPGTILLLENYAITDKRVERPCASISESLSALTSLNLEIKLNELSKVTILPNTATMFQDEIAGLPDVEYSFVERAALGSVAEKTKIDVVGLVTYVSCSYRTPYKLKTLLAVLWVEMIDSSSYLPFRAMIVLEPNRLLCDEIRPGKILVCTQMKVNVAHESQVPDRADAIFLMSSTYSEIYVKHTSAPYVRSPAVIKVASIIKDHPAEVDFLRNHVLREGGLFTFPKQFRELSSYAEVYNNVPRKMVPGANWKDTLEELGFREKQRVFFGGFIIHIEYVDYQTVESTEPIYGWSYASDIKSRRTVFLNIQEANKTKGLQVLNPNQFNKFFFALKYSSELEEEFQAFLSYPPTTAEMWHPSSIRALESLPVNVDGVYIITIASLHYEALVQCIMIPEPSEKPHPSFCNLASGQFRPLPLRQLNSFLAEPPRYTWSEVRKTYRTASEVSGRTFAFVVDLYRPESDIKQVLLHRAFLCPPEQVEEYMRADQVR